MIEKIQLFFDCLFSWAVKERGGPDEGECIVIQSFGGGKIQSPGLSNVVMAKIAKHFIKLKFFPVIAQQEVAWAMDNCRNLIQPIESVDYINTWQVCSEAAAAMKSRGWHKAVIIAHPLHLWRVAKHFEKLGVEVVIPYGLEQIPFDPNNEQWWTRSAFPWVMRELVVRIYCLFKGYI